MRTSLNRLIEARSKVRKATGGHAGALQEEYH
jgi:hypothetical protein